MQTRQFFWWNDTNISILFWRDYAFIDFITAQNQRINIQCLLPPAYVVRRKGTVFTGVCLSTGERGWGTRWPLIPGPFQGREYPLASSPRSFLRGCGTGASGITENIGPLWKRKYYVIPPQGLHNITSSIEVQTIDLSIITQF